jgi:hypothetical protein
VGTTDSHARPVRLTLFLASPRATLDVALELAAELGAPVEASARDAFAPVLALGASSSRASVGAVTATYEYAVLHARDDDVVTTRFEAVVELPGVRIVLGDGHALLYGDVAAKAIALLETRHGATRLEEPKRPAWISDPSLPPAWDELGRELASRDEGWRDEPLRAHAFRGGVFLTWPHGALGPWPDRRFWWPTLERPQPIAGEPDPLEILARIAGAPPTLELDRALVGEAWSAALLLGGAPGVPSELGVRVRRACAGSWVLRIVTTELVMPVKGAGPVAMLAVQHDDGAPLGMIVRARRREGSWTMQVRAWGPEAPRAIEALR